MLNAFTVHLPEPTNNMPTLRFLCPLEFFQAKQVSASIWSNWISLCCWVWELSPVQSLCAGNVQSLSCHETSTGKYSTAAHENPFSCAPTDPMSFSSVSSGNVQLGCPWIFIFFFLVSFLCSSNFPLCPKSAYNSISELPSLCMFCGSVCTGRKQNSYHPWVKGKYSHFSKSESSEGHLMDPYYRPLFLWLPEPRFNSAFENNTSLKHFLAWLLVIWTV